MTEPALTHDARCTWWVSSWCCERDLDGHEPRFELESESGMTDIYVASNTKLEQQLTEFAKVYAEMAALKTRLDELKDGIKVEAPQLIPDHEGTIVLHSDFLPKPLEVIWCDGEWFVDQGRLRTEQPMMWATYAKPKKGYWKLQFSRKRAH